MAADVQLLGIGDLKKSFAKLSNDMIKKTSLRMVASAGGVLRTEAKRLALSQGLKLTGALVRNIAIKRERNAPPGVTQYNLGVRHGRHLGNGKKVIKYLALNKKGRVVVRRQNDPFYWWFLERGRRIVSRATGDPGIGITRHTATLKNGKVVTRSRKYRMDSLTGRRRNSTGFVEATPFIQPALENKRAEALAAMEKRLQRDLERAGK